MSVPKHKRSESPMEFLHNALGLRREMTELLLRDFGVKSRIRKHLKEVRLDEPSKEELEWMKKRYGMTAEDCQKIDTIINNATYDVTELEQYPEWLISYFRSAVLRILENLLNNLYYANSIYITKEAEYSQRRGYLNQAIGNCYQLTSWMDYIRQTLPVDANKYERYLIRIQREIALVKGVRTADNKTLAKIRK